jgi:hypothetical protein
LDAEQENKSDRPETAFAAFGVSTYTGCQMKKKEATQRGKTASPLSLVTVLTTVTENREQELMLSSPVSLAPSTIEQSKCHGSRSTHIGYVAQRFIDLLLLIDILHNQIERPARVKST